MNFLIQAREGLNHWWRYLLTLLIIVGAVLFGQVPYLLVLFWRTYACIGAADFEEALHNLDYAISDLPQNFTLALLLVPFAFGLGALLFCVKFLHQKPVLKILTSRPSLDWQRVWFGFFLWFGLSGLADCVFYLIESDSYTFQFEGCAFWGLLLVAIVLFPLQTSFEELLFRGYLMQGISLLSKFAWIPWVVSSVTFGAMHFMNPEVMEFGVGLAMTYYIATGLFLGLITIMDEGLEMALGIHAATNLYAALFVTFDASAVQTPALFKVSEVHLEWMLVAFFLSAVVVVLLARRRFGWKHWSKCYSPLPGRSIPEENNATFV